MSKKSDLTYAEANTELQSIVAKLTDDQVDIDELATLVKRATFLIDYCKKKLVAVEREVETMLKQVEDTDQSE